MVTFQLFNEKSKYTLFEFEFLQTLGSGSFANVKLVKEKKTGKLFALKMVRVHEGKTANAEIYNIKCEIFIHRKLDHPNIIKFHDYIQYDSGVYFLLDYTENGNLYTYLHRKKFLTDKEIFRFFYQTCQAVQYLHQNDVLHRDIKPENLLLDKDLNIKLCDFGWATQRIQDKRLTFCGTYEYMAPEIAYKRPYDYRVDIWSLGVLLYELIHSEPPFRGRSLPDIYKSFTKGLVKFNAKCPADAKDLIQKILRQNPNDRLSLSQILSHPWVKYNLSKEENVVVSPGLPQTKLLHSTSLPPEITVDVSERQSKEYCEPKTATNANNKLPQYDTWSEYLKGQNVDPQPPSKINLNTSDTVKTTDKNNKTAPELREETYNRILHPSSSNKDLHHNVYMQYAENAQKGNEVERARSPSPKSANVIVNSHTPNVIHTPNVVTPNVIHTPNVVKTPEKGGNKNKIFENNIFSPSFKSKLTNAIRQLTSHTPTNQGSKAVKPANSSKNVLQQINQNTPINQANQTTSPFSRAFSVQEEKENHLQKYLETTRDATTEEYRQISHVPANSISQIHHQQSRQETIHVEHNHYPVTEEHPFMPSSTATTRTNTLDLSHGNEVRSPFERSSKDAVEQQYRQVYETGNENIKASPESGGHYKQVNNADLGRYLQVSNSKKALQLKGILGANVVRYHIPISLPNNGPNKNKENFL